MHRKITQRGGGDQWAKKALGSLLATRLVSQVYPYKLKADSSITTYAWFLGSYSITMVGQLRKHVEFRWMYRLFTIFKIKHKRKYVAKRNASYC